MRKANIICALIILIIGTIVVYDGIKLGVIGWGAAGPRTGLYPFVLGMGIIIGTLIVLGQAFFKSKKSLLDEHFIRKGGLKPVLYVAIPAALMVFLTEFVGLYIAAGLYIAIYMRWVGRHRWISVLAISTLLPLASYFVFYRWFLIPLPMGRLGALLGF